MNYLMINTAGKTTEILLSAQGKEYYFSDKNGLQASTVLLPKVDELLSSAGIDLSDVDLFGCVIGPGSFTGIRIGVVTVKTFCYALKKSAVAINYNKLIGLGSNKKRLTVVYGWADVYYAAMYDGDEEIMQPTAVKKEQIDAILHDNDGIEVLCDAYSAQKLAFSEACERQCMSIAMTTQTAVTGEQIEPLYAMKSQAERELGE